MRKIICTIVSFLLLVTSLPGSVYAQPSSTRHSVDLASRERLMDSPESRSLALSVRHSGEEQSDDTRIYTDKSSRMTRVQTRQYIPASNNLTFVLSSDSNNNLQESMLVKDYLTSSRVVINERGEVVQTLAYYPYGATHETWIMNHGSSTTQNSNNPKTAIQTQSGSAISEADPKTAIATSLQSAIRSEAEDQITDNRQLTTDKLFTSHRKLNDLSVYHAGARFYSPTLGTFIQPDPVEGINRYAYVANNPILNYDPDGKDFINAIAKRLASAFSSQAGSGGTGSPIKEIFGGNFPWNKSQSRSNFQKLMQRVAPYQIEGPTDLAQNGVRAYSMPQGVSGVFHSEVTIEQSALNLLASRGPATQELFFEGLEVLRPRRLTVRAAPNNDKWLAETSVQDSWGDDILMQLTPDMRTGTSIHELTHANLDTAREYPDGAGLGVRLTQNALIEVRAEWTARRDLIRWVNTHQDELTPEQLAYYQVQIEGHTAYIDYYVRAANMNLSAQVAVSGPESVKLLDTTGMSDYYLQKIGLATR